ncbi:MAG: hypothetical protein LBM93_02515 [Oscillospiraceae bacterium]|nr:hypothetical protein [Oscillospiraceae bacterium]
MNFIKVIGIASTILGVGSTLVTEWVNDKKLDKKIAEQVAKALSEMKEKS